MFTNSLYQRKPIKKSIFDNPKLEAVDLKIEKKENMEEKNERKLKLIWDFKGPGAERTAEHHALHLKEFIQNNNISLNITGFEAINDHHFIAFMVVKESQMPPVRDALKPHRGQLYQEEN